MAVIEKMRKPTKSKNFVNYVVYAVIFGMIIASFVLMIPGLGGGGVQSASDAATVGSVSITKRDYLDQVKQLESQYSRMFNGEFPEFMRSRVRQSAIQGLVRTEVLSNYAEKKGLYVAGDEVGYMLKEVPVFQEDGEFSRDRYDNYLSYVGKSASQFENQLQKQIASQRLDEFFSQGLMGVPQEAVLNESADSMSIEFEYIELSPKFLKDQIKVAEEEVKAMLASPEGMEKVKLFYPRVESDFMGKEQVQVSQILLEGKTPEDKKKADEIRAQITAANFADMAKKNSIDPLTKEKGGDLGFITKGDFLPAIENKAFSMKEGEISDPIKTTEGYAIILTGAKKEPEAIEFDKVKDSVTKLYLKSEGAKVLSKELGQLVKEKKFEDLSTKVSGMGMSWKNPGKFSLTDQTIPGVGQSQVFEDALFSLKKEGDIFPQTIEHQGKEYLVKLVKVNKVVEDTKKSTPNLRQGSRGRLLLDDVFERHQEKLKVKINPTLFES